MEWNRNIGEVWQKQWETKRERFIEYSRYCCDMKYFKLEIIYWFFEFLSRFRYVVRLIIASRARRESRKLVGVCSLFQWNPFFYSVSNVEEPTGGTPMMSKKWDWDHRTIVIFGIHRISQFKLRHETRKEANNDEPPKMFRNLKLSPINVPSFDELINFIIQQRWAVDTRELRFALKFSISQCPS